MGAVQGKRRRREPTAPRVSGPFVSFCASLSVGDVSSLQNGSIICVEVLWHLDQERPCACACIGKRLSECSCKPCMHMMDAYYLVTSRPPARSCPGAHSIYNESPFVPASASEHAERERARERGPASHFAPVRALLSGEPFRAPDLRLD